MTLRIHAACWSEVPDTAPEVGQLLDVGSQHVHLVVDDPVLDVSEVLGPGEESSFFDHLVNDVCVRVVSELHVFRRHLEASSSILDYYSRKMCSWDPVFHSHRLGHLDILAMFLHSVHVAGFGGLHRDLHCMV